MGSKVAVCHLVRASNGIEPLVRFLSSYRRHASGMDHELILILKGFRGRCFWPTSGDAVRALQFSTISVPDRGFDLGSYRGAAATLPHEFILFLNSFSSILADDYLAKMMRALSGEGAGAASATSSWESLFSDLNAQPDDYQSLGLVRRFARAYTVGNAETRFPAFPNPHLRTNAVLMRRKTLLSLSLPTPRTKWQALALESGYSGITRQLLDRGEGCLVVARDGSTYEMRCWPKSQTFRSGNQENLLIADNKTREYDTADEETRRLLRLRTWGPMGERVEGRAQRGVNDSPGEATAP